MTSVPPSVLWSFLLAFFSTGDTTPLAALADRLEEAGDPRSRSLRRRWRAQAGLVARAKARGPHGHLLTEVRLQEYVLKLFPECEGMHQAWSDKVAAEAVDRLLSRFLPDREPA